VAVGVRRLPQRAAYTAYLVAFMLVLLEILVRFDALAPRFDLFGLDMLLDSNVLFRVKGNSHPEINALGYRDREFEPKGPGSGRRTLVLGDSFMMALHMGAHQTLPKQLEGLLAEGDVYNMGVQGDGPDQALIRLLHEGIQLEPDRVILALYAANDFSDLSKNRLFDLDERGELQRTAENALSERLPSLGLWYLVQFLRYRVSSSFDSTYDYVFQSDGGEGELFFELFRTLLADNVDHEFLLAPTSQAALGQVALMEAVLGRMRDELARLGVPLVVVIIPSYFNVQDLGPFRERGIAEENAFAFEDAAVGICQRLALDCLNLYPLMQARGGGPPFYNSTDLHLSIAGTRFVTLAIYRHLTRDAE